jgi:hypothetical protein
VIAEAPAQTLESLADTVAATAARLEAAR